MKNNSTSRTFISGKAKRPKKPTRVLLAKGLAFHFQKSIRSRLDALDCIKDHELKAIELSIQLDSFINESYDCINTIFELKNGITKRSKDRVAQLRISHDQFKGFICSMQPEINHINSDYFNNYELLLEDCLHFINQFRMTCDLVWDLTSVPNRPADRALKEKFLYAVIEFQEKNRTHEFPTRMYICQAIGVSDLRFSERRYRDWKAQLLNHTFHHVRQPKKSSGNKYLKAGA